MIFARKLVLSDSRNVVIQSLMPITATNLMATPTSVSIVNSNRIAKVANMIVKPRKFFFNPMIHNRRKKYNNQLRHKL
jgi:hypothetical protein